MTAGRKDGRSIWQAGAGFPPRPRGCWVILICCLAVSLIIDLANIFHSRNIMQRSLLAHCAA